MGPVDMVHGGASEGARLGAEQRSLRDGHALSSVREQMAGHLLKAAQHVAIAGANCESRFIRNELKQIWDSLVVFGLILAMGKPNGETGTEAVRPEQDAAAHEEAEGASGGSGGMPQAPGSTDEDQQRNLHDEGRHDSASEGLDRRTGEAPG